MRHDDKSFVPVVIQQGMQSLIKARMGLMSGFCPKDKLIWPLKELTDGALEGIMRKKWHVAPVMFVQIGANLYRQSKVLSEDISRLFCLRLATGYEDSRFKFLQMFPQPVGSQSTFLRKLPCVCGLIRLQLRHGVLDQDKILFHRPRRTESNTCASSFGKGASNSLGSFSPGRIIFNR